MIELKLRRFGSTLSVVSLKVAIARLHAQEGTVLHRTRAPDDGYRIVPPGPCVAGKMAKAGASSAATAPYCITLAS